MISVKLGFVMAGNALAHMPASVLLLMLSALSVREASGITGAEYSAVLFATISFVKMISLNIRPAAKFWKPRPLNVFPVIDLGNILVSVVRPVFVMITHGARFSNKRREESLPALSAGMKHSRQRI